MTTMSSITWGAQRRVPLPYTRRPVDERARTARTALLTAGIVVMVTPPQVNGTQVNRT
ncbi:MAG: hypothetical protein GWP18_00585 [Proteobacteria bacterium]|nr:hypothetical protein [Pseudomonadota bacterium]